MSVLARYNATVSSDPEQQVSVTSRAAALLHRAGLRRTPVRAAVLIVLGESGQPLGVPQVLERLPHDTDAVTVYRTLNTFTQKQLVHRVHGEDRTWRYALSADATTRHEHPHFVCDACGTVECLEQSEIPKDFIRSLHVASRYSVHYPEVVLHGVCPKCHD